MLKHSIISGFIALFLVFSLGVDVSAQTEDSTTGESEVVEGDVETGEEDVVTEGAEENVNEDIEEEDEDNEEDGSTEEDSEVIEDDSPTVEELNEENIEEEPLFGDVIEVRDDEIILETEDGSLVSISTTTNVEVNGSQLIRSGSVALKKGDRAVVNSVSSVATTGIVVSNENGVLQITTSDGQELIYRRTASTPSRVAAVAAGDEVTIVVSEEGEILGVDTEVIDLPETRDRSPWGWIILIIVILALVGWGFTKKNEEA